MQNFQFHIPTKIIFGTGEIGKIDDHLSPDFQRILIVTDPVISHKTPWISLLMDKLKGREVTVFDAVEENPSFATVNCGGSVALEFSADLILGIGGGSSLDAAKGIALIGKEAGRIEEFVSEGKPVRTTIPIVCIPTTSGTGSEVTPFAVFTDAEKETKVGFAHESIFPALSIIDPELTYTMPRSVIINTGLDAMAHSVEAFLSLESFDLNDVMALKSIRLVVKHLNLAAQKDPEAMGKMAYASMLGGMAITHASTILPHIMGYPLTVYHQVPHGRACTILLPSYLDFLAKHHLEPEKLHQLNQAFEPVGGLRAFLSQLNVSTKLTDYGVEANELANYVQKTIVKGDVRISPGNITAQVIRQLYKNSL